MPSIDRNSSVPFYRQLYGQIADGIESGLFPTGKKLPSIRECARELAVSNTTVELAYQKLAEEGYVEARRGSGYTIRALQGALGNSESRRPQEYLDALRDLREEDQRGVQRATYDFAYDQIDPTLFPFTAWARICREVFFGQGASAACLYNDRQGLLELREQIVHYVASEYGLDCACEQVLIMPTTRQLTATIMTLFDPAKTTVAMEEPGYDEVSKQLIRNGFDITPVPTYPPADWADVERSISGAQVVFATPASQFPTSVPMMIDQRRNLVSWAHDNDAYLIDDEYGWEFQSGASRCPSLGALDKEGRVITLGTFSNSFMPAVCLSYAVLPPQLMRRWREGRRDAHPEVPWQTQAAMAAFMREGHWRTHVRKIRTAMQCKHEALLDAVKEHLGDSVDVLDGAGGLFMLVRMRDGRGEADLIESAAAHGVRVYPTRRYWKSEPSPDWNYVLIGYSGINKKDIGQGVKALADAWLP